MTSIERELYRIDHLPIFQNRMYDSALDGINCVRGHMRLVQNEGTGLIYNRAFQPEVMVYDSNYQNEQACSAEFRNHLENVVQIISQTFGDISILEVGCGKGYFLEMLQSCGYDVVGFDPTYEGSNSSVYKTYFSKDAGISREGIILRHVLEHIENPVKFLNFLKESNGGSGLIYIEVPCFDWIISHKAWFDIFYEHVNYFRTSDFHHMFDGVLEIGHIFGGQYIYVVADISTLREPVANPTDLVELPSDFTSGINRSTESSKVAIWGGASKGTIFSFYRNLTKKPVDIVIDINPAKQGKYLAGTGLKVLSPEDGIKLLDPGSTIYVMNSNYIEEIRNQTKNNFSLIGVDNE
ncbi:MULTISPECIES: class I SAM-dependent methyltransferase [Thalassospira]|nr:MULTISPECIES: class I SAM-dependent methyltransferase [Thalassospira]MCH2273499.1 class I SAM-dependent methyltransferase [Thalassospira sp.]